MQPQWYLQLSLMCLLGLTKYFIEKFFNDKQI